MGGTLVEADHRPAWVIGFGVQVQHISMWAAKSALPLGMHHSCFCHGLSSFFQMQPHRLVGQGFHQSQFYRLPRQQPQGPVVVAPGGRPAGQGNQMRFPTFIQLPVPVDMVAPVQRLLQSLLAYRFLSRITIRPEMSRAVAT